MPAHFIKGVFRFKLKLNKKLDLYSSNFYILYFSRKFLLKKKKKGGKKKRLFVVVKMKVSIIFLWEVGAVTAHQPSVITKTHCWILFRHFHFYRSFLALLYQEKVLASNQEGHLDLNFDRLKKKNSHFEIYKPINKRLSCILNSAFSPAEVEEQCTELWRFCSFKGGNHKMPWKNSAVSLKWKGLGSICAPLDQGPMWNAGTMRKLPSYPAIKKHFCETLVSAHW